MKLMYKCAICGAEYGLNGFTNHIQRTHKIKYKDYYDTYVEAGPHLCKYCSNECIFNNYTGYRPTCHNPTCVRKLQHETMRAKYGKSCKRPEKIKAKEPVTYKYTCALCGAGYQLLFKLNGHINKCHPEISVEAYHVKYLGVEIGRCVICGKKALWKGTHYHTTCGSKECLHELRSRNNAMHNPVYLEKAVNAQLNMTEEQKAAKAMRYANTCLAHFGVDHNWKYQECRQRCVETTRKTFGTANGFQMPNAKLTLLAKYGVDHFSKSVEFAHRRKKKYVCDGIGFDSKDEIMFYAFARLNAIDIEHHPDIRFNYVARHDTHIYEPDFRAGSTLYEVKGAQFFRDKDVTKEMINPYDRTMDDIYEAKHQCMLSNGVHIVTDPTVCKLLKEFYGIDLTDEIIIDKCFGTPFPGTTKWPAGHPIWKCFVPGHMSPKDAWSNKMIFGKAVRNMLKIVDDSLRANKYHSFCQRHITALRNIEKDVTPLCRLILNRFTVAKYAPKVTALQPSTLLKIIEESGVDLSAGVYCPMAGFGGIVKGVSMWFAQRNKTPDIEAYDINDQFCNWYGWTQRDVLKQVVHTDKVVVVCPPFGKNYEHWEGTPDEMADISFIQWVALIKQHVIAPQYVFIGPELESKKQTCGLFAKKVGIALYKE